MTTLKQTCDLPFICPDDAESIAREVLSPEAYAYIRGGAADEITVQSNRQALNRITLRPRILVDVSRIDTRISLFGRELSCPILLAPIGCQRTLHCEGEIAAVRAVPETVFVISTASSSTLEEIAREARGPLWFQLYPQADRALNYELVQRAVSARCEAICITVDSPVLGTRNCHQRAGVDVSAMSYPNLRGRQILMAAWTWKDFAELRRTVAVPLLIKGVLTPEDALRACSEGADAVVVSNHGGRNLDTLPATAVCLPSIARALAGRIPIIADGGVRRGTDVVKFLALGASAVMLGRPYAYALAVAGTPGVRTLFQILRQELESAMALLGRPSIAGLDGSTIWASGC